MLSLRKIIILPLLVLVISACSAKTSYRFIDWIVAWQVDDYIQWDEDQEWEFQKRLKKQISWHRTSQLPLYSDLLSKLTDSLSKPLVREELLTYLDTMESLWANVLINITPDAVYLLSQLNEEQIADLSRNIEKEINRTEDKYRDADKDDWHKDRVKRVEKIIARFIGRLSDEQEALIEQWSLNLADTRSYWVDNRRNWAKQFDEAMLNREQPDFEQNIYTLFVESQSLWSDEYKQLMDINYQNGIDLVIAFQATLSEKQLKKLLSQLNDWKESFDDLAKG